MWRNPNHPQPSPQQPPEPSGRLIAAFERPGRGRGPDAELRITLDEYQGNAFLSVRVWNKGTEGFYPTKSGCSVRMREAEDVASALMEGFRLAGVTPARLPSRPASRGPRQRPSSHLESVRRPQPNPVERSEVTSRPVASTTQLGFDPEFDEFQD